MDQEYNKRTRPQDWKEGPTQNWENAMNTLKANKEDALMESKIDLEGFVITAEDEEAIRDAVEQQMRGLTAPTGEQK